jgi:hypothetical protein
MAAWRCINDFLAPSSANVRTGLEMNIGEGNFELKLALINIWCSTTHSATRPQKMLMLIFNTSWRSAAHSLSEE